MKDVWHYPRKPLAEQVTIMFEVGLSSAFIFFAPSQDECSHAITQFGNTQQMLAGKLGIGKLTVSTIQSAIRTLQNKSLIRKAI